MYISFFRLCMQVLSGGKFRHVSSFATPCVSLVLAECLACMRDELYCASSNDIELQQFSSKFLSTTGLHGTLDFMK